jgi:hypothetical protein
MLRSALMTAAITPTLVRRRLMFDGLPSLEGASEALRHLEDDIPEWRWSVVLYPAQASRRRAYVHLMDEGGRSVGFVKWGLGRDGVGIASERDALTAMAGGYVPLRTPKLLAAGNTDSGATWLATEALPATGAQPRRSHLVPNWLLSHIKGATATKVDESHLNELTWWADLQRQLPRAPSSFRASLESAKSSQLTVARCHGDLGPHNIAWADQETWIFDWEASAPDGPEDVDAWGYRVMSWRFSRTMKVLAADGTLGSGFVWACAFGLARQSGVFPLIVSKWDELRKAGVL